MANSIKILEENLQNAGRFFCPGTGKISFQEVASGHIHRSFIMTTQSSDGENQRFFLQQFNQNVFPDIDIISNNTKHICDALAATTYPLTIAVPQHAADGSLTFKESNDFVWRCFSAVPNAYSIDSPETPEQVYQTAYAFAVFQKSLVAVDPAVLKEPIVSFMDNPRRFSALVAAEEGDLAGRVKDVATELGLIHQCATDGAFEFIAQSRILPGNKPRVTHGDMKINNVLFDKTTRKPVSIIDLDTCMVGDYLFDYGDYMRIACATASEDEPILEKVAVNTGYMNAAIKGFQEGFPSALPTTLWKELPRAAAELTLTVATRFLTDYLNGDVYFKVAFAEHNLVRARNQLALYNKWCDIVSSGY